MPIIAPALSIFILPDKTTSPTLTLVVLENTIVVLVYYSSSSSVVVEGIKEPVLVKVNV